MSDGVPLGESAAGELRMGHRIATQQKKCRLHTFAPERIEDTSGRTGLRPVVEGQYDLLACKRKRVRELLAANPWRRRGVYGEHPRGPERVGIAGAGRGTVGYRDRRGQREEIDDYFDDHS